MYLLFIDELNLKPTVWFHIEASFLSLEFPEVDFNSTDVFKLDQEIIVKTTAKPEATTTPSIQTTEANAFRVSMSSEVLSITEAPADESKQTTTATQVSSTSESKLTVTPSDPIVPFEFLSTITGMGMGLVPVSSTEAILKPTKNTGQKTTTEYDWTHIFSEEYQKGKWQTRLLIDDFHLKLMAVFLSTFRTTNRLQVSLQWSLQASDHLLEVYSMHLLWKCPRTLFSPELSSWFILQRGPPILWPPVQCEVWNWNREILEIKLLIRDLVFLNFCHIDNLISYPLYFFFHFELF